MSNLSWQQALQKISNEEHTLQYDSFSNEDALELGLSIVDLAKQAGKAVAVDITKHGVQVFHYMMTGTTLVNNEWLQRKHRVVELSNHSSYYLEIEGKVNGQTYNERHFLDDAAYGPYGGGFPIWVKGTGMVGIVTVSGLTAQEDHELIVKALSAVLKL